MVAKEREGVQKAVPQFVHLRRKIVNKYVPPIKFEVGFVNRTTEEVTILKDLESIPTGRFPPNEYRKQYEIASVKVNLPFFYYYDIINLPLLHKNVFHVSSTSS